LLCTPTKADDIVSVSSEGTPQKPDMKRTRLGFECFSSTVQCSPETIVLSDSEQGSSSCKPVVLSSSDSESHVDESGLGLESRYVRVASQ